MSGAGSNLVGGRWNSPGHHVVYASGNLSLSMLELLVHVDDAGEFRALAHVFREIGFPSDAIAHLRAEDLPVDWDARPESRASQVVGDEWIEAQQSVVLAVPSVIIPSHHRYDPSYMNYLINPGHPEFDQVIEAGEVLDLEFDFRLK